jgi:hypothetical protein
MAPHFTRNANDLSKHVTSDGDRTAHIREWLNRACESSGHGLVVPLHLQDALSAVLSSIPEIDAQTFLAYDPIVVCLEGCMAQVSCQWARPRWQHEGGRVRIPIIHFVIDLTRQMPDAVVFLVAHELAHIVLGHLDEAEKTYHQREAEVALKVAQWGFSKPRSFYPDDPGMRLCHLTNQLDETVAQLERSEEDDTWVSIEEWAIPRLRGAIEGLRDLLRPPQLRRLCAQFRAGPDLTHEPLSLRDACTQDPPAPPPVAPTS